MKNLITFLSLVFYLNTNAQIITTVAGNGTAAYSGDGGQATSAAINAPWGSAVDAAGNLYIADYASNRIRKVSTAGIITTISGTGSAAYGGDNGPASAASLYTPTDVTFDASGNLYICDEDNFCIRKVNSANIITTIAGSGGNGGFTGDGGQATAAELLRPTKIVFGPDGNLYISDTQNNRIRKVTTAGVITTIAGTATQGYNGDGGQATAAQLYFPYQITFDAIGNLYVADAGNNRIRMINTAGIISTVAGIGTAGFSGDNGQATAAQLNSPHGLTSDAAGNLYIADMINNRIRMINTSGIITTIAGNGTGTFGGDGGQATAASLKSPTDVVFGVSNNLYITDNGNNRIRMLTFNCPVVISGTTNLCSGGTTTLTASGAATYTWSANAGSVNTTTVTVSPTSNTTYTLLSSDATCSGSNTITVNVTTTPTLVLSGDTTLCSGTSTTLTASGATSYTWASSAFTVTTQSVNVSPSADDTFTVTAANGSCTDVKNITVHVTPTPSLTISGLANICSGTSTILTASGATSYTWGANANNATTNTVSLNPTSNTTYSVTGVNGFCAATNTIMVNVTATPTLAISGNTTLCLGDNTTLTASGATTYTWSANANNANTNTVTINPIANDTYTLTGANGNCTSNSTITVTVIPLPTITSVSDTICTGQATLHATGASTYTWNPTPDFSNGNSSSVIYSPTVTTTYTITGTATTSCVGTTTVAVVVDCNIGIATISNIDTAIKIYPNPAQNNFTVEVSSTEKQQLQIFDVTGKQVLSQTINGTTNIDVSHLNKGVYNISITSGAGVANKRLVIVK